MKKVKRTTQTKARLTTTMVWFAVSMVAISALGQAPSRPAATRASQAFPKDVDPESGFRLPLLKREQLDDEGKKIYDGIVGPGTRSIAGLWGPAGIRLYSPKTSALDGALRDHLRFEAGIPADLRELIILCTAREWNNQFEWAQHEPNGLKAGLSQKVIDIVKYRDSAVGLPEPQQVVIQLSRDLFRQHKVQPDTFARARKAFGEKQLVDIVSLIGDYSATAVLLDVFDMQLPPGQAPALPVP